MRSRLWTAAAGRGERSSPGVLRACAFASFALLPLLPLLPPGAARAQVPVRQPEATAPRAPGRPRAPRDESLRGLLGEQSARAQVRARDPETRLRGIARLGAIGTPEAIEALVDELERVSALDPAAPLADARSRLEAVRALAPHARRSGVRDLLVRFLNDASLGALPLGAQVRGAASLALARGGDPKAIAALVAAVEKGGPVGEAAGLALTAHPPASLEAALKGRTLTAPLVRWLGAHGDLRAAPRLEKALAASKLTTLQVELGRALASLGSEAPAPLARSWLAEADPALRVAGGEVLAALGHRDAPAAIAGLLADDATRAAALRLAGLSPSPKLVPPLEAAASKLEGEAASHAVLAIGLAGGPEAAAALSRLLASPALSTAAAHALAGMPGAAAAASLDAALASAREGAARRLVVRAGLLRVLALGSSAWRGAEEGGARLEAALASLGRSNDVADRAVAAFGEVALGLRDSAEVLAACGRPEACPAGVVGAAARGALARGAEALTAFGPVLEGAGGGELAVAAGVHLLAEPTGGALPTRALAAWAEGGGALSPLAARALPSRDDEVTRGRIKALLSGGDPVVRAHVALGLARDPEPDAVHLLVRAYRFEESAEVRRAIVRALSRRREPQKRRTLELARDLDADGRVRALAEAALAGRVLDHVSPASREGDPAGPGPRTLWVSILPNAPLEAGEPSPRAALLVRPDGLALPLLADPDGVMLIPGLPDGASMFRLAEPPASRP